MTRPTTDDFDKIEQVLCGRNTTRNKINEAVRHDRGYRRIVDQGDKLVSLWNTPGMSLYNGTLVNVAETVGPTEVLFRHQNGQLGSTKFLPEVFGRTPYPRFDLEIKQGRGLPFDYGYCLTCHKSQGSEWDSVCVVDEGVIMRTPGDIARWRYTAASRARTRLVWASKI